MNIISQHHNNDLAILMFQRKPDNYRQTDATLQLDNTKYTLSTEIQKDKIAPMFHFILTSPQGVTEVLSKFQKVGDTDYTGD